MNLYGNKFGYHTPRRTEKNFLVIKKETNLDWVDNSWHNDLCDSMHITTLDVKGEHKYFEIYLPNADCDRMEDEMFNTFSVSNEDRHGLFVTSDINEVIKYINNLKL
jgi:hypothetical protein